MASLSFMDSSQLLESGTDEIHGQKNLIISKQKSIISQLRQTNMELQELLVQKNDELHHCSNEKMQRHLREYQDDIYSLKHQVSKVMSMKTSEVENYQNKLGKAEYELSQVAIAMKELEISKSTENSKILKLMKEKELELKIEQQKNVKLNHKINVALQENKKLQSYLGELATFEEFKTLKNELNSLKKENNEIHDRYKEMQKVAKSMKDKYVEKEMSYSKLRLSYSEKREELMKFKTIVWKYNNGNEDCSVSIEELTKMSTEFENLIKENESLKEKVESCENYCNTLCKESIEQQKLYEDKEVKFMELIESLKDELEENSYNLIKLSASHQETLMQSLEFETELKEYKEHYTEDFKSLLNSLSSEIALCAYDLKSFLNLIVSRIKGAEPSISALLGLRDSNENSNHICTLNAESIASQLRDITGLRKEINAVRHQVSDHYAEEIGDCMCLTQ